MQKCTGLILALAIVIIAALSLWLVLTPKPSTVAELPVEETAQETQIPSAKGEVPEEFQDNLNGAFEDLEAIRPARPVES